MDVFSEVPSCLWQPFGALPLTGIQNYFEKEVLT